MLLPCSSEKAEKGLGGLATAGGRAVRWEPRLPDLQRWSRGMACETHEGHGAAVGKSGSPSLAQRERCGGPWRKH